MIARRRASLCLLAASLAVVACGGSSPEGSSTPGATESAATEAPRVTGAEARQMVASGAVLLDVTPAPRAERSLIEGRTHIPLDELEGRLAELPRDRDIVVYCLGGGRSPRAGALLRERGYQAFVMGAKSTWDDAAPAADAGE